MGERACGRSRAADRAGAAVLAPVLAPVLAAVLAAARPEACLAQQAPAPPDPPGHPAGSDAGFLSGLDALPFLPVPEIDTSPYSGLTLGLIPVFLSDNDKGQIDRIVAPDVIYSQYFGWGARWRLFRNRSEDEKWSVVGGAKEHVEREFDARYDRGLLRDGTWTWSAEAIYDRSGTGRFYGLGNDSQVAGATSFIDSKSRLEGTAALNLTRDWQLAYRLRAQTDDIEQSTLLSLPSIVSRYPDLPGVGHASELQQRLALGYDTRDSVTVPRSGERLIAFAGGAAHGLGGSASYDALGLDASVFRPLGAGTILAAHAAVRYMPAYAGAPFWVLSSVGGDRSVVGETQPLRAYGSGRFVDRNSFEASVEMRSWVRQLHMLDTDLKLELAPFVDTGKVFSRMQESPLAHQHAGGGLGFRVVASPFVVGYVDVGYGNEGAAIFSGIDYPF
jgi:hypothetical protein